MKALAANAVKPREDVSTTASTPKAMAARYIPTSVMWPRVSIVEFLYVSVFEQICSDELIVHGRENTCQAPFCVLTGFLFDTALFVAYIRFFRVSLQ